jgi:hypothetical protein
MKILFQRDKQGIFNMKSERRKERDREKPVGMKFFSHRLGPEHTKKKQFLIIPRSSFDKSIKNKNSFNVFLYVRKAKAKPLNDERRQKNGLERLRDVHKSANEREQF